MHIVCFGDSNTYGYDPCSYFGGRYSADSRWVDILAEITGHDVLNFGENGREIPRRSIDLPEHMDVLVIMLGTNDLLQGGSADSVAEKMESFLERVQHDRKRILLVSPPMMTYGAWVTEERLITESQKLGVKYREVAHKKGTLFADAGKWDVALTFDGVHFSEEGHKVFGHEISKVIAAMVKE